MINWWLIPSLLVFALILLRIRMDGYKTLSAYDWLWTVILSVIYPLGVFVIVSVWAENREEK